MLGEIIGHYVKDSFLGGGNFGKVFRVHDINDKTKIYALKQIEIQEKEYLENAIKLEKAILVKVENENSVKLFEAFDTDEYHYLVFELCDSDLEKEFKLHRRKQKRPYNELEICLIISQLNNCLKKMREETIIHRDLKLPNILIKYDKNIPVIGFIVKLSDFGLSKELSKENELTNTVVGSPVTRAPEVLFSKGYNAKADLWGIGVIIFQLLYNTLPFKAHTREELERELRSWKQLIIPKDVNNPISNECLDLLNKLFVRDPAKRIDFDEYFRHKFFSDEHKIKLFKKYTNIDYEKIINVKKEVKINRITLDDGEFGKKFVKLRIIKEYQGYKLYKGRNEENKQNVYIREISRDMIDKSKENLDIFNKEIQLLASLNNPYFAKYIGIYETKTFYYIILEYFQGNILDDFIIKRKGILNDSLNKSIKLQLQFDLNEMKKRNIILKNINSKSLIFAYYQNENNFTIKIFDYYINSLFIKKDDKSLNYKYEDLMPNNNENKENLSNQNNSFVDIQPRISDENLENILEIIKNKIEFIIKYFKEFFDDKNMLEIEAMSDYFKEIIILLYFCFLECNIIISFLNINGDTNLNEIDKNNQEIHYLKLYLKIKQKYEYSYINFLDDSKIWYYNKENPSFDYFLNIFHNLKNEIYLILNNYIEQNKNHFTIEKELKNENSENNIIDLEIGKKFIEKCIKEGNLEKLFSKLFENIISIYPTHKRDKISKQLMIVKYTLEYIIFIKLILQNENNQFSFHKIIEKTNNTICFSTFIGNKIKYYRDKKMLNLINENDDETDENILLEKLINFYIKIIKYIQ